MQNNLNHLNTDFMTAVKLRETGFDAEREVLSLLATKISLYLTPPEFLILEFNDKQLLGNVRKKMRFILR